MPILHWIGKEKVVNHHQDVPFRVLEHAYGFRSSDAEDKSETKSGNKIIHGDNLEALKALLPEYEGRVKCIYIDPPYNTGNEKWVYNDSVSHPKILKWLGDVVGKEGEDFSRHDKWLCMMYPRIKLLYKLLQEDGFIVIHIDENEYHNLILILEEIFGKNNNLGTIIWDKKNPKGDSKKLSYQHESIIVFSKNADLAKGNIKRKKKNAKKILLFAEKLFAKIGKESYPEDILHICKKYKLNKALFKDYRFIYNLETANKEFAEWIKAQDFSGGEKAYKFIDKKGEVYQSVSMAWPNKKQAPDEYFIPLIHPITKKQCPIPNRGWRNPPETMNFLLSNNLILFGKDESTQPRRKYLLTENMYENISSLVSFGGSDDDFQNKIGINLENPKPYALATELVDWFSEPESIILDSFAGSGTTAHAVMQLNKKDGGNRKFISIELMDYAETITAERIRRVANGYNDVDGLGGEFDYYELGEPIFDNEKNLNEVVGEDKIREYIYYTETKQHLSRVQNEESKYLLDTYNDTGYYFYYEKNSLTTLGYETLDIVTERAEQYIIYADRCTIDEKDLATKGIIFKKIPRDIKRF